MLLSCVLVGGDSRWNAFNRVSVAKGEKRSFVKLFNEECSTMTGLKLLCKDIRLHNTESTHKQDQMYAFTRWTGGGWGGEGGHGGTKDRKQIGGEKLS